MNKKANENVDSHIEEVEKQNDEEPKTVSASELELEQLRKTASELREFKDKYYLLLAELENTRKRLQKEKQDMTRFAVENVICEFLAPLDSMEKALGFTDQMSEETRSWANGFKMLLTQFKDVLSQHGVATFHSTGMKFDPHLHEAVEICHTDEAEEDTVIEEFVKGYKCHDRVLRPARVKVAKKPVSSEVKQEEQP